MELEIKQEYVDRPSPASLSGFVQEPEGSNGVGGDHRSFETVRVTATDAADAGKSKEIARNAELSAQVRAEDVECFALIPKTESGNEGSSGDSDTFDGDEEGQSEATEDNLEVKDDEEEVLTRTGPATRRSTRGKEGALAVQEPQRCLKVKREIKRHDGSILCLICNGKSKRWAKKWDKGVHLLESFCKVLELPSNKPVKDEVKRSCYCFVCQRRVIELVHSAEEVERLQNRIVEIKSEIKCTMEKCLEVPKGKTNSNSGRWKAGSLRKTIIDGIKKAKLKKSAAFQRMDSDSDTDENLVPVQAQSSFHDVNYGEPSKAENLSDIDELDSPEEFEAGENSDFEPQMLSKSKARMSRTRRKSIDPRDVLEVKLEAHSSVDNSTSPTKPKKKYVPKSEEEKPVKCDLCHRRFEDEVRRNAHVKRSHEGLKRSYCCDFDGCTKSFKALGTLKTHQLTHTGETPFMCELCGKGFKQRPLLLSHQQNKHRPESRKFKCDYDQCDRAFTSMVRLTIHKTTHTKKYPFICEICAKGFTSYSNLRQHSRVKHSEENPYTCDFENCGKHFCSKVSLIEHKFIHTKDYPLSCSECGLGFTAESRLNKHMKRKHSKSTVFECDICQKTFYYKESIKKHKMSHTGERPHICDTCGKSFVDRYKLKRHQLIHSGERLFACDLCHKTFYTKDYLKTHMSSHHNASRNGAEKVDKKASEPKATNTQGVGRSKTKRQASPTSSTENTSDENSRQPTPPNDRSSMINVNSNLEMTSQMYDQIYNAEGVLPAPLNQPQPVFPHPPEPFNLYGHSFNMQR